MRLAGITKSQLSILPAKESICPRICWDSYIKRIPPSLVNNPHPSYIMKEMSALSGFINKYWESILLLLAIGWGSWLKDSSRIEFYILYNRIKNKQDLGNQHISKAVELFLVPFLGLSSERSLNLALRHLNMWLVVLTPFPWHIAYLHELGSLTSLIR